MKKKIMEFVSKNKKILKKILPVKLLRKIKFAYLNRNMKKYQKEPIDPEVFQKMETGVNLIGDIQAEIGLGQSIRLVANELQLSKYPFTIYNFQLDGNVRRGDHSFDSCISKAYPYPINIFHINQHLFTKSVC